MVGSAACYSIEYRRLESKVLTEEPRLLRQTSTAGTQTLLLQVETVWEAGQVQSMRTWMVSTVQRLGGSGLVLRSQFLVPPSSQERRSPVLLGQALRLGWL